MNSLRRLLLWAPVIAAVGCSGDDRGNSDIESVVAQEAKTSVFNSVMAGSAASFYDYTPERYISLDVWEADHGNVDLQYMIQEVDTSLAICETYTYWDCPIPPGCGGGEAGFGGGGPEPDGGEVGGTAGSPPDPSDCCWPGEPGCCSVEECCVEVEEEYCFYPRSTWEYGYGTIPKTAFQNRGKVTRLAAFVEAGPQFTIERCLEDWFNGIFECAQDEGGGAISVVWASEPGFQGFRRGVEEQTFGAMTIRVNGTERYSSARASGSFFGTPLAGVSGAVRRGKTVLHEITRTH